MLMLDRYKSYKSAEFQKYYKVYNIIILRLFLYLSHLTQLLDIKYFNILKQVYGQQIEMFIKAYINYITKIEFFLIFTVVYKRLIITQGTQAGFYRASLLPFNLQIIILKLNIKLRTLNSNILFSIDINLWVS